MYWSFFSATVNVAMAVGITVGVIFLLLIVGVPICIGVSICYATNRRRYQPLQAHVVATTGATVVTSRSTVTNPVPQPNTRLISHEAPPSYAATTATAYPFQQPPQVISLLQHLLYSGKSIDL